MAKKMWTALVSLMILLFLVPAASGSAAGFGNKLSEESTKVAPAITHITEAYQSGSIKQNVHLLDINLNGPYTMLDIGIPDPLNSLQTTTSLAQKNSYSGHQVVGAVNASYFLSNRFPASLIARNNEIINYGVVGEGVESPTQERVAFGVSKSGKAIADYYSTNLSFTINGNNYSLDRINSVRETNQNVLYTPKQSTTGTNQWGTEIVVQNASQNMKELHFGDKITGTVSKVTAYGQSGNTAIPSDGFVISIQNKELAEKFSTVSEGTPIEVNISIDQKWMDAQFILAAGPLLVKDGQVNISMPASSNFASDRHPRTAVAIDSTGSRVFFVTVDGRQSGYSNGSSLRDLAAYLISKGASAAINLDGGGSTTMAVRKPGYHYLSVMNRPSDGAQRNVSAILQAVNTAPAGKLQSFTLSGISGEIQKGAKVSINIASAYDEYMNPVTIDPANVTWKVEGNIGNMSGSTFTANEAGTGKIIAQYQGVTAELPVRVVQVTQNVMALDSFDQAGKWAASSARANASITGSTSSEPFRQGTGSLKLSYDFTTGDSGTKAAYAAPKSPIAIAGLPKEIGLWVYGDSGNHWLRGMIKDGNGKSHTIDFTEQGGLNWTGWKYVTASIPTDVALPLTFDRLYITEPNASRQNKGQVYFDKLQAVYVDNHQEPVYTDVGNSHWAGGTINALNGQGLIKGYPNGTFKPDSTITRAEAATIMVRALNLKATTKSTFTDVKSNHFAYEAIAAAAENGIIMGREAGKFYPQGELTRAEMATMMKRAFDLSGTAALTFTDMKQNHWAYDNIATLMANNLTSGYPDNTFKPNKAISRAEFAVFLERALKMNK